MYVTATPTQVFCAICLMIASQLHTLHGPAWEARRRSWKHFSFGSRGFRRDTAGGLTSLPAPGGLFLAYSCWKWWLARHGTPSGTPFWVLAPFPWFPHCRPQPTYTPVEGCRLPVLIHNSLPTYLNLTTQRPFPASMGCNHMSPKTFEPQPWEEGPSSNCGSSLGIFSQH